MGCHCFQLSPAVLKTIGAEVVVVKIVELLVVDFLEENSHEVQFLAGQLLVGNVL
jgi:hypothetical protein